MLVFLLQNESKKSPKRLEIFSPNFTRLLHVPIYTRLQIFIQLPASLTKLCYIKHDHSVHIIMLKISTIGHNARWHFLTFSPNSWDFLVQILHDYYTFLSVLDYQFLFTYLPTVTKLCHIKCDHPACVLADCEHFEHVLVIALNT